MDDFAITIVILVIVGLILAAVVLPIVALVIAINSKKKLDAQLARLAQTSSSSLDPDTIQLLRTSDSAPLAKALQQLAGRIEKIEAALAIQSIPIPVTNWRDS